MEDRLQLHIAIALQKEPVESNFDTSLVHIYSFSKNDLTYDVEISANDKKTTRVLSEGKLIIDWSTSPEEAYYDLILSLIEKESQLKNMVSYMLSFLRPKNSLNESN